MPKASTISPAELESLDPSTARWLSAHGVLMSIMTSQHPPARTTWNGSTSNSSVAIRTESTSHWFAWVGQASSGVVRRQEWIRSRWKLLTRRAAPRFERLAHRGPVCASTKRGEYPIAAARRSPYSGCLAYSPDDARAAKFTGSEMSRRRPSTDVDRLPSAPASTSREAI
jgi:hypothetical protein